MNSGFLPKKTSPWLILCLVCGVFFIGLYIFLRIVDPSATNGILFFLLIGIITCLICVFMLLFNRNAFFRMAENALRARYHWFGRLDCRLDDVAFVLPQVNTLTILLKNGKRHIIMGLQNPGKLSSGIRRKIFRPETAAPDELQQALTALKARRQRTLRWMLAGVAMLFINILIAVILTGGRELRAFHTCDWICLGIMGFLELLTAVGVFVAANHSGQYQLPIEQLKYRLRGAVIVTQPLSYDNMWKVYTDANHTGRIILCRFPGEECTYHYVQVFTDSFVLETLSAPYDDEEDRLTEADFSPLIDITAQVLP